MGKLVFGLLLLAVAFFLRLGAATVRTEGGSGRPIGAALRTASYVATIGILFVLFSTVVVVNAGQVGVRPTLTAEALTRQYFDVLRELKSSNNMIILVPTEGGVPILNLGDLRRNLRQP